MVEGGKTQVGPTDRHWLLYTAGCSLLNVWVAALLLFTSPDPLKAVLTDGSLLVYCCVTMWLSVAVLREEVRRGNRSYFAGEVEDRHDRLIVYAVVLTVVIIVLYVQFVMEKKAPTADARMLLSGASAVAGALYAREALSLSYTIRHADEARA